MFGSNPQNIQITSATGQETLQLKPFGETPGHFVVETASGKQVGEVLQETNNALSIVFYRGKGGLAAIITSPKGLKYFALPGSKIELGKTRITLPGNLLGSDATKSRTDIRRDSIQTVTSQAHILGAGLATRFEPVSGDNTGYAKPCVPLVGAQSVIACIAEALKKDGVTSIFINTFYKPDALKKSLSGVKDLSLQYLDEPAPSGTAGGLRKVLADPTARPGLMDPEKPLLVVQGDAVTDVNFSKLLESHRANNAAVTIGCQFVRDEDVNKFGIAVTDQSGADGQSGQITGFMEKPALKDAGPHRLANTGFYIFSPEVYPVILEVYTNKLEREQADANAKGEKPPTETSLDYAQDLFPEILKRASAGQIISKATGKPMPFYAQMVEGYWCDIGNASQYLETIHDIYAGKVNVNMPSPPDEFYENGILYWPDAKALAQEEGAKLSGNVIVARPFQG